jgi:thioredoxin 1
MIYECADALSTAVNATALARRELTKAGRAVMREDNGYATTAPTRAEVDALTGATVLEFGTDWCGYCRGAQPRIAEALARAPQLRHMKVEDGPGRPLGRSFKVKLWPTLIFLRDGVEVARVVRPTDVRAVEAGVAALA